ncbi:uncharacterized protein LOC141846905 [Curcuma longa]|uniref:uncharacterized protein LOC141846905 n=1 Tax=Curcuma longa TaxID=136217 RepID=UPI003D9F621B
MAFPSFPTIHLHPPNRNQQHPNYRSAGGDGIEEPSAPAPITRPVGSTAGGRSREAKLVGQRPEQEVIKCPRCDSTNTKFCYFNNHSLSQPRHFCKACRRYWTRGGALREVPVGGGRRKNKRRTEKPEPPAAAAGGGTGTSSFEPNYPLASSIIHRRSSGPPPAINMPSPASWMDPLPDRSTMNIDPYATNPANYYEVSATGSPNNNLGFEINSYLKLRQQFPFNLGEEHLLPPPPPPPEALQPFGEPVKMDRDVKAQQLGNSIVIPQHLGNSSRFDRSSADGFIDWSGTGNSSAGGGGWPAATAGGEFTTMSFFRTPPTDSN